MNVLSVNLEQKLVARKRATMKVELETVEQQKRIDAQIEELRLGAEKLAEGDRAKTLAALGFTHEQRRPTLPQSRFTFLKQDRIFTTSEIQDVCCTYGLRFLPTGHYNGHLDRGIAPAAADFAALVDKNLPPQRYRGSEFRLTEVPASANLTDFRIAAPVSAFTLLDKPKPAPAPDPLLFVGLGNDQWYLLHKWGNDLTVFNRVRNWNWNVPFYTGMLVAGMWLTTRMLDPLYKGFAQPLSVLSAATLIGFVWFLLPFFAALVHSRDRGGMSREIQDKLEKKAEATLGKLWNRDRNRVTTSNWNSPFKSA